MSLSVAPFERSLDGLGAFLAAIEEGRERALTAGERELVGPFPSYVASPDAVVTGRWDAAEQNGWRALIRQDGNPLTVVDFQDSEAALAYAARDAEAASAFAEALEIASGLAGDANEWQVRWLTVPGLYVTALWLAGEPNLFGPTRLGASQRPAVEIVDEERFREMVTQILPPRTAAPAARASEFPDAMPGSRSGPPE